ncbi:uncharacterized protein LOC113919483 [Zalophus californianus]|uniref:Uncharacterized protein LOC113919483 n=1 Tax=Zalophus californianus TaxID=9704 RepID=A0A6J2CP61_ZALCA|nr:uncharacterized protein LOC113919483 [Zalophus californianus]
MHYLGLGAPGPLHSRPLRIKSKQSKVHTGLQKLRCLPPGVGSRPVRPLHLQLRPRAAGPRRASPRPPPPSAAETALRRSPRLLGRAPRRRRGAALTPKVQKEKEQWQGPRRSWASSPQ